MKIIIIGSSIAGSAIAYLLAKEGLDISVYEAKKRKDVGKKVCANVYTHIFKDILKEFDLDYKGFVKTTYGRMNLFSKNNSVSFPTEEYEIDKEKFVEMMIKNAEKKGARFNFGTSFIDLRQKKTKIIVKLKKKNKIFSEECDILIGADGVLSEVAKKANMWQNRRQELYLQTKIKRNIIKNKEYIPRKNEYNIFIGKDFGYYSYVFSLKEDLIIGLGDLPEKKPAREFANFLMFLGINKKPAKIKGALVPEPQLIKNKKNIFLIGDAACQIKFTGGGVVPALISAVSVRDIIIKKDYSKFKKLRRSIFLNRMAEKLFSNFSDKDWDSFLGIIKDKKFKELPQNRDNIKIKSIIKAMNLRLFWLILRKFIFP